MKYSILYLASTLAGTCFASGCSGNDYVEPTQQLILKEGERCGDDNFQRRSVPTGFPSYYSCASGLTCKRTFSDADLGDGEGICSAKAGYREGCAKKVGCAGQLLCVSAAPDNGICLDQCEKKMGCSVGETCTPVSDLPGTSVCTPCSDKESPDCRKETDV